MKAREYSTRISTDPGRYLRSIEAVQTDQAASHNDRVHLAHHGDPTLVGIPRHVATCSTRSAVMESVEGVGEMGARWGGAIYTTNAIESLNRVIRKSIKTRGSFPNDNAATKLIYLAIPNFEKDGRNVRFAARNQFAIMFGERFDA